MDLVKHAHGKQADLRDTACKVCASVATPFDVVDFRKVCDPTLYPLGLSGIPVYYHRCGQCDLIFTRFFDEFESDDWRTHIYNASYVDIDPDYVEFRPRQDAKRLDALLRHRKGETIGLDYGGGAGLAAQLLRALGYRYDAWDPYGAQSMTSEHSGQHNFCSTFEVAEHSTDPLAMFRNIVSMTCPGRLMIFVGTQVHDGMVSEAGRLGWWYVAPRNGHVTIHSRRSLSLIAEQNSLDFHSFSRSTHFMTRGYTKSEVARFIYFGVARRRILSALRRDPLRGLSLTDSTS